MPAAGWSWTTRNAPAAGEDNRYLWRKLWITMKIFVDFVVNRVQTNMHTLFIGLENKDQIQSLSMQNVRKKNAQEHMRHCQIEKG